MAETAGRMEKVWDNEGVSLGIYISVPFCRTKCSYCNFASDVFSKVVFEKYVQRVCDDIARSKQTSEEIGGIWEKTIDSIYLGGGTPTVLQPEQLKCVFDAVRAEFAVMATEIDAAKLLTMRAASMKDAGMKSTQESSMAKLFASEVAVKCANEGVQIHGGYGFIKDYPAEKFYRDVKLCTIGEGTSEIQRLVIARQLLKD